MDYHLQFTVAEITTCFDLDSNSLANKLSDRYESFSGGSNPHSRFTVTALPAKTDDENATNALGEDPRLEVEGDELVISRGDFIARYSTATQEGTLTVHDSIYSFDAFYRVFYTYLMLKNGGFMLHASAVRRKDDGYIFTGPSGSGKSTISGLSSDNMLLSDELAAVMLKNGVYYVHGNPFWGDFKKGTVQESAPIRHLFFLRKARENSLESVPIGLKLKHLLGNVLFFGRDISLSEELLTVCVNFLQQIPAAELHFVPDESVWRCIENA